MSNFPGSLDTDLTLYVAKDRLQTTLTSAQGAADTTATVASTAQWATGCIATIESEQELVTSVASGTVLNVTRNINGAGAVTHDKGKSVSCFVDANYHTAMSSAVQAIEGALGANLSNVASFPSSLQLQYLRRKPNVAGTIYEFTSAGLRYLVSDYNFPTQTPGGLLVIGANTITLSPVPIGVNGADSNHYLYISSGTGTAEACLIIGGSGVAGASSGQIVIQCANTHSGAWTVSSATGGAAEANQAVISAGGHGIVQFDSACTFYQGVYATSSAERTIFRGLGLVTLNITRAASYVNGDLLHNSVGAAWTVQDLGFQAITGGATAGASVYVGGGGSLSADHLSIFGGQFGIRLVGAVSSDLHGVYYTNVDMSFKAVAGLSMESLCINVFVSDCAFGGRDAANPSHPYANANIVGAGMRILSADGVWVSNTVFSGDNGILISPLASYIANVYIIGGGVDGVKTFGLLLSGGGQLVLGIFLNGVHLNSQSDGATGAGSVIYIAPEMTGYLDSVVVNGGEIAGGAFEGIIINATGMKCCTFTGVAIHDNNVSNTAGKAAIATSTGVTGLNLTGCQVGNTFGIGHQAYALIANGTLGNSNITGNNFLSNGTAAMPSTAASGWTNMVLTNNSGIDDTVQSLASGTSISIGVYPVYDVGGNTTTVTIAGGWKGRRIRLIKSDSSTVTIGGSGNIPAAHTLAQYGAIDLVFDGTNWY